MVPIKANSKRLISIALALSLFASLQALDAINVEEGDEERAAEVALNPVDHETEVSWEYEPRVWTPDESSYEIDNFDSNLPSPTQDQEEEELDTSLNDWTTRSFEDPNNELKIRDRSHFYKPKFGPNLFKPKSKLKSNITRNFQTRMDEDKCDQFRVDISETVICDRQRCDKLDFEWPKYDNQMIVVQTTKFGMRFYQAYLEFKPPGRVKSRPKNRFKQPSFTNQKTPIKLDILDLFKPKPSTRPSNFKPTTTSTTTTTAATTTDRPSETAPSTTRAPPSTARPSPAADSRDCPIESQDNNRTQLVTTFKLSTQRPMQKILGFGGALSDSTCRLIKSLSPTMAKSLIEDYFGPRGLQYTIVRMSMGSSDFSLTPYTNNDKPYASADSNTAIPTGRASDDNEMDDVEMRHFHLTSEDYEYKLPMARQAIATSRRELKFFSSLWSPPVWMKNNSHIVHGYLKGDVYGPYYKALADLIVKWLEAYRRQGIEFWGTTGLNEPITGVKPFIFHNSLGITRDDYVTWIKLYLIPMLKQRGFENIKLIPVDDNKGYMQNWAGGLLEDPEVRNFISGISIHWYMNDDYDNLNFLINKYPDKFLLSSEACNGYYPFQVHVLPGDWDRGVAYMYDIMQLMHKNVVGWVDWNMVLNIYGGPSWPGNYIDSPILVNSERDEYYKSPTFYAMGHYSRFVVPDSHRLDHRLTNARYDYPLDAAGFYTPDGYVVVVVLNANRHPVKFKVIVDKQVVRTVDIKEESFNTIVFKWKRPR